MSLASGTKWNLRSLDDLCEIVIGRTPARAKAEYWGEGYPWLSIADMRNNRDLWETKETITDAGALLCRERLVQPGTIVFSFKLSIGKVGVVRTPMYTNEAIAALPIKDKSILCEDYLYYALNILDFEGYTDRAVMGQTLNKKKIALLQVPLPPLEEQRRIAAILDKADEVRRKRKQAIALTEELLRSVFLDMFGDPVTNPKGWEVVELHELLAFLTSGSRGWAKYYAPQGDFFLRIQNVKRGKLLLKDIAYVNPPNSTEARRTCVREGDILFSMTADLGRTAVIPKGLPKAYINQHLAIIRVNKNVIYPTYLSAFLSSEGGQSQVAKLNREGVKAGLNFDDIKKLKILVPPIEIQYKYEELSKLLTCMSIHYNEGCDSTNNLFNSLLQKAFRGEL